MNKKWVLVTGGSRGIGQAITEKLANDWQVRFTWHSNHQAGEALNQEYADRGLPVQGYCCNGADAASVNQLGQELLTQYGAPYAIIHNAGLSRDELHINQKTETWHQVIDANLHAVFNWHQILLKPMIMQGEGGAIVMLSSVTGLKGNPGQGAYAASKAALMCLTRTLCCEVARFNIRVNCLAPGLIDTDMLHALKPAALQALQQTIPMRRLGKPQEVAEMVSFLISDASQYLTGQTLILDGGMTA